ncbi:MAG: hypothetical protein Q8Q18_00705, partial [bacterium]|nr:hypothetical protein [bacterium]
PSPTNHFASCHTFWLQNFVSRSLYLDKARAPTCFSLEMCGKITVKALIGDGIMLLIKDSLWILTYKLKWQRDC